MAATASVDVSAARAGIATHASDATRASTTLHLAVRVTLWRMLSRDGCPRRLRPALLSVAAVSRKFRRSLRSREWPPHRLTAFRAQRSARSHRRQERYGRGVPGA